MSAETEQLPSSPQSSKPVGKRRKLSMERIMVLFALFFVGGIALLTAVPEEHPVRGLAMTAYTLLVFWAIFRFAV